MLADFAHLLTYFFDIVKEVERRNASRANRSITDQECFADIKLLESEFEEFKKSILKAAEEAKAVADQELIGRGMYNSTVRDSRHRQIERDVLEDIDRAHRSMRTAIEKLEFHRVRPE